MVRGSSLPLSSDDDGLTLLPTLAWLSPRERYDRAAERLLRTAGRLLLAELRAAGITLRLDGATVLVGPRAKVGRDVIERVERHRTALMVVLEADDIPGIPDQR